MVRSALSQTLDTEPGDIFACWGSDCLARGISFETSLTSWLTGPSGLRWSPSHVAIACHRHYPDHLDHYWWESTTLSDRKCLEYNRPVRGVQVHEILDRINDYVSTGGAVAQYRLCKIDKLDTSERDRLRDLLMRFVGGSDQRPVCYDTGGAIVSGLRVLPRLPVLRSNLETVFCSELLAALLQRLGRMNRENPTKYNPGLLLRQLVRQGTYGKRWQMDAARSGL